jgi:hypothetical protein
MFQSSPPKEKNGLSMVDFEDSETGDPLIICAGPPTPDAPASPEDDDAIAEDELGDVAANVCGIWRSAWNTDLTLLMESSRRNSPFSSVKFLEHRSAIVINFLFPWAGKSGENLTWNDVIPKFASTYSIFLFKYKTIQTI